MAGCVEEHFGRKVGEVKDVVYWKQRLLEGLEADVDFLENFDNDEEVLCYDYLKCIELQLEHPYNTTLITRLTEMFINQFDSTQNDSLLVVLNILLKSKTTPPGLLVKLSAQKVTEPVLIRRINLLSGTATLDELLDEDDLIVYYLNKSKDLANDFNFFCSNLAYDPNLLLDFILYDDNEASFLQVLIRIFKQKPSLVAFPQLMDCLQNLVSTLQTCKNSLPYNPSALLKIWQKR